MKRWGHCGLLWWTVVAGQGIQTARADTLTFNTVCDNVWQGCCACGDQNCNNWSPPMEGVCPAFPGPSDTANVSLDCVIGPPPLAAAVAGVLNQTAGTLTINGALQIGTSADFDGTLLWNASGLSRATAANATCAANSGFTMAGPNDKGLGFGTLLGGIVLENHASSTWSGAGSWTIGFSPGGAPATFKNLAGRTFDGQTDAPILRVSFGLGIIDNDGTITKSVTTGTSDWNAYLDNSGLVHVQTGTLRLSGDGQSSGEFRVDAGAALRFATTGFDLNAGATLTGTGDMLVEDTGTGPAIHVNDTLDIDRMTMLNSSFVDGTGEVRIHELLTMTGADEFAPLRVLSGAELSATGGLTSRVLDACVEGTLRVSNATLATAGGNLTIQPGGIVEMEDSGVLDVFDFTPAPIQCHGTIRKSAGSGVATVSSDFQGPFNLNPGGQVQASSGTLRFDPLINSSGDWQVDAGANLDFESITIMNTGSLMTGDGLFRLLQQAQSFRIAGGVNLAPTNLQLGDATHDARIEGSGGTIGTLTVTNTMNWIQGSLDPAQQLVLTIPQGATINFAGVASMGLGSTSFVLGGTANFLSTFFMTHAFGVLGGWTLQPTGVVNIQVDSQFDARNRTINNAGTILRSAGAGNATFINAILNNTGLVRTETGVLRFERTGGGISYTQTAGATELAGGSMYCETNLNLNGGRLTGAGTITGDPNNAGAVVQPGNSAGILSIAADPSASPFPLTGSYTQGAGGTLEIELGGLAPGTAHDQLVVAGTASLNGTLHIAPINGFLPQVGDSFTILTAASRIGTFSQVTGAGQYNVIYNPSSVILTVAASPADSDGDGDVDLADHAEFAECLSGPNAAPSPTPPPTAQECLDAFDFNEDGDVDLADFSVFQLILGG